MTGKSRSRRPAASAGPEPPPRSSVAEDATHASKVSMLALKPQPSDIAAVVRDGDDRVTGELILSEHLDELTAAMADLTGALETEPAEAEILDAVCAEAVRAVPGADLASI